MLSSDAGIAVTLVAATLIAAGCGGGGTSEPAPPPPQMANLAFVAQAPGSNAISTVSIEISGPGIAQPVVVNLSLVGGQASGSAQVLAGAGRLIAGRGFDASAVNTHRGDTTVTLVEGNNPTVTFQLLPLVGTLPAIVSFGSTVVTMGGRDTTLSLRDSLQLTASAIRARGGSPPADSIRWASSNPAVASVTVSGRVRALAPGLTDIVATYEGAAAKRVITVAAARAVARWSLWGR
jgi:hypothetical protein